MARCLPPHFTLAYKQVGTQDVLFDIYLPEIPPLEGNGTVSVPAVVYFHGGGLTVGNRESWFPFWLHSRRKAIGNDLLRIQILSR